MRLIALAAGLGCALAAFTPASAQDNYGEGYFETAPYTNPPPATPQPQTGWPNRPREYYRPDLTGPAPFLGWAWLVAPSRWTFFGGRPAQYYCHSAVDWRGVQITACETNDPRDYHLMR